MGAVQQQQQRRLVYLFTFLFCLRSFAFNESRCDALVNSPALYRPDGLQKGNSFSYVDGGWLSFFFECAV